MKKKVLSLLVGRDDGVVRSYFGIEHENKVWLVTAWVINTVSGEALPERMIRIDSLTPKPIKFTPSDNSKFDYANILLPKAVIEGVSEYATGFEVRSLPEEPKVHRDDLFILPSIHE